jgi:hypothetical protein
MVFLVPLMAMLLAGTVSIVYLCWQGVKVQQAANLAARIEGQERIAGGASVSAINEENGFESVNTGPSVHDDDGHHMSKPAADELPKRNAEQIANMGGLYERMVHAVSDFFGGSAKDANKLIVQEPTQGLYTDTIKINRVLTPPSMMGLDFGSIKLNGTAYGGEDTKMYALPRWGETSGGGETHGGSSLDSHASHDEYKRFLKNNPGEY